jgi:hypothetical protein
MNGAYRPIRFPATLRKVFRYSALGMAMAGCSLLEIAPVDDGSYLTYTVTDTFGGTYPCTLHFKRAQRGLLEVTIEQPTVKVSGDDEDEAAPEERPLLISPDDDGKILVSRFLKRRGGMPLSLAEYGPVWLQPHSLKPGDTTGADLRITGKIDKWHGQEVCVVELTGMQTVIRGTWYYSTKTGILIGCEQGDLAEDLLNPGGKPAGILLTESNISGLN